VPIYPLLKNRGFEPEQVEAMGKAFEATLRALGLTDRSDPLVMIVARKIIELGQQGERDPQRLQERALAEIRG
jgi:hypothetical protein